MLGFLRNSIPESRSLVLLRKSLFFHDMTMETIGFAKIAFSASHAKSLGYLAKEDEIVMNRRQLLFHAKSTVLKLYDSYTPPEIETFKLPGKPGILAAKVQLKTARKAGKILMKYYESSDKDIKMKGADTPVTVADHEADTYLLNFLTHHSLLNHIE